MEPINIDMSSINSYESSFMLPPRRKSKLLNNDLHLNKVRRSENLIRSGLNLTCVNCIITTNQLKNGLDSFLILSIHLCMFH